MRPYRRLALTDFGDGFLSDRKLTSVIPGGPIYLPCYRAGTGANASVGTVGLFKTHDEGIVRDPQYTRAPGRCRSTCWPRAFLSTARYSSSASAVPDAAVWQPVLLGNHVDRRCGSERMSFVAVEEGRNEVLRGSIPKSGGSPQGLHLAVHVWNHRDVVSQRGAFRHDPVEKLILNPILAAGRRDQPGDSGELDAQGKEVAGDIGSRPGPPGGRWSTVPGHEAARTHGAAAIWGGMVADAGTPVGLSGYLAEFLTCGRGGGGIVEEFSSRRLAHHSDKPPALSAIADGSARSSMDEYAGGHRRKHLIRSSSPADRKPGYRVPAPRIRRRTIRAGHGLDRRPGRDVAIPP